MAELNLDKKKLGFGTKWVVYFLIKFGAFFVVVCGCHCALCYIAPTPDGQEKKLDFFWPRRPRLVTASCRMVLVAW